MNTGKFKAIKGLAKSLGYKNSGHLMKNAKTYTLNAQKKGLNAKPITGRYTISDTIYPKRRFKEYKDSDIEPLNINKKGSKSLNDEIFNDPKIARGYEKERLGFSRNEFKSERGFRTALDDHFNRGVEKINPADYAHIKSRKPLLTAQFKYGQNKKLLRNKANKLIKEYQGTYDTPRGVEIEKELNKLWPKLDAKDKDILASGFNKTAERSANRTQRKMMQATGSKDIDDLYGYMDAEDQVIAKLQRQKISKKKKSEKILEQLQILAKKKQWEA